MVLGPALPFPEIGESIRGKKFAKNLSFLALHVNVLSAGEAVDELGLLVIGIDDAEGRRRHRRRESMGAVCSLIFSVHFQ